MLPVPVPTAPGPDARRPTSCSAHLHRLQRENAALHAQLDRLEARLALYEEPGALGQTPEPERTP